MDESQFVSDPDGAARVRMTSDPRFRMATGELITDGVRVWDNDLRSGTVSFALSGVDRPHWDGWFYTLTDNGGRGLSNGERMTTRHPFTREAPPPAPSWCEYCRGPVVEEITGLAADGTAVTRWVHATDGQRVNQGDPGDLVSGAHNHKGTPVRASEVTDQHPAMW